MQNTFRIESKLAPLGLTTSLQGNFHNIKIEFTNNMIVAH